MTRVGSNGTEQAPHSERGLDRKDILAAAAEEFALRGYRGTNLLRVSERLGVTRQALYHYFQRKHDILRELMLSFFDELEEAVTAAQKDNTDPVERFRAMLRGHFRVVASRPVMSKIFALEEASLSKEDEAVLMERRRAQQARFAATYADGVRAGVFRDIDPRVAVSVMLGAGNWMYRWVRPGGRVNTDEIVTIAEKLLFAGYGLNGQHPNDKISYGPKAATLPAPSRSPRRRG